LARRAPGDAIARYLLCCERGISDRAM
jgi:hypothetical protein